MTHIGALLAVAGAVALLLASLGRAAARAFNEKSRQTRRGLRKVLDGEMQAFLIDYGHGRGIGLNFTGRTLAVTWDAGQWCLLYRIEELLGVELIVDEWVTGWAFVDEHFWSADPRAGAKEQVLLRFVFADPKHAEFELELWSAKLRSGSTAANVKEAVELGNRWIEEMGRLLDRRPHPASSRPAPAPRQTPTFRSLADS